MSLAIKPDVKAIIDRCAAIDWHYPPHYPDRAITAYRRRLDAAGANCRVEWIDDPDETERFDFVIGRAFKAWRQVLKITAEHHFLDWEPDWRSHGETQRYWSSDGHSSELGKAWRAAAGWPAAGLYSPEAIFAAPEWDQSASQFIAKNAVEYFATLRADNPFPFYIPIPGIMGHYPPPPAWTLNPYWSNWLSAGYCGLTDGPANWWRCLKDGLWDSTTAWDAGIALQCLNASPRSKALDEFTAIYTPMIDAFEAGAFAHCLLDRDLIILAAPKMWMQDGRLERSGGPVLCWPRTTVSKKDFRT